MINKETAKLADMIGVKRPVRLVDAIGLPALLEQMTEECLELGHACAKYSRKLRGDNEVHGRSEEMMLKNIHEEMADVMVTMRELRKVSEVIDNEEVNRIIDQKRRRMAKRLGLKEDSFIF